MPTHSSAARSSEAGYSLIELLISMGLLTVIMGATLGGLADVIRGNETVLMIAGTNKTLRGGMDMMVRDLLQVGSGLPPSHAIAIPSGVGAAPVRLPGPPGTSFATTPADFSLPAVIPRPAAGPMIGGVATDVLSMMAADNAFISVPLTAVTDTTVVVGAGLVIDVGPDRIDAGQLMMINKGSLSTLVQVTGVDYASRQLTFAPGDSLNLNQPAAANGSLAALNAAAPANTPTGMLVSRVRMITYYLDDSINVERPRLVRRVNNGHPTGFDNSLGTAIAFDVPDLQFRFDINNGGGNPGSVEMVAVDLTAAGACAPVACSPTQIRKVEVVAKARSMNRLPPSNTFFENTLRSQVALRGMAFVDRYR